MLESLRNASWKARLLNLALFCFFFAAISGCGIAFLGVLQEGTQNNLTQDIWQFYYNGIQDEELWFTYGDMNTSVGNTCQTGGRILLLLELVTLFCLFPAWVLSFIRLIGIHISKLQPAAKFLNAEFGLTMLATIGQFFSCLVWGVTCYHSSSQIASFSDMTPTGYIWLILCIGYCFANVGIYFLIRADPSCVLGSVYGGELNQTDGNDPLPSNDHLKAVHATDL